jgi:hypothetical protein
MSQHTGLPSALHHHRRYENYHYEISMKTSLLILSGDDVQYLVQTALDPREVVRCMARTFELVSGSEIGVGVVS